MEPATNTADSAFSLHILPKRARVNGNPHPVFPVNGGSFDRAEFLEDMLVRTEADVTADPQALLDATLRSMPGDKGEYSPGTYCIGLERSVSTERGFIAQVSLYRMSNWVPQRGL